MSNHRYSPEFKDEAVLQVLDRGYSVAEVSERLGVSAHSHDPNHQARQAGAEQYVAAGFPGLDLGEM